MIRPEKYQFNWKPKTKSKEDLELVKKLNELVKTLNVNKTQLTRQALEDFIKKNICNGFTCTDPGENIKNTYSLEYLEKLKKV